MSFNQPWWPNDDEENSSNKRFNGPHVIVYVFFICVVFWCVLGIVAFADTITWEKVENVEGYKVNFEIIPCQGECSPSENLRYSVNVGDTDIFVLTDDQNFQPSKCYKLQVSAYVGQITGPLSRDVVCTEAEGFIINEVKKKSR